MLFIASGLRSHSINATDGAIGTLDDLLIDDQIWMVRWVVVDTGTWIAGRKVLLPTSELGRVDQTVERIHVPLTRKQVEDSPGLDSHAPVSRQMESDIYGYYGWSPYWNSPYWAGTAAYPAIAYPPAIYAGYSGGAGSLAGPPHSPTESTVEKEISARRHQDGDPHLRSANYITGFYIEARDGSIGHVEDFIIDDDNWSVRYAIVDTVNWWPGRKVLIAPQWIREISWSKETVAVDLTRDQIETAPEYVPGFTPNRAYEERLHEHYGRDWHWPSSG